MKNENQAFPSFEEIEKSNKLEIRELTLQHGLAYPTDEELIMLILGSGTKESPVRELAKEVLGKVMCSNSDNLVENLMLVKGMGKSKALMIAAALELGKRINRNPEGAFETPRDLIPYIQSYGMQKQEHFLCISLNGAKEIISIRVVCTGSGNMAVVKPADVFSEPVKEHAAAVVISHNHPCGLLFPSKEDIQTTLRLSQAAELLGITLLDHIILSKNDYYSFLEHELMTEEKLYNFL
ncbi:MAG: DNA repair protein RadC [Treponema sp.]|nr:DNA repair protein RadC [Treponema sp.]